MIERMAKERLPGWLRLATSVATRLGLSATVLTLIGLAVSLTGALLVGNNLLVWGGLVFVTGSAVDMLDGAVARARGASSVQGALLDAVSDRVSETAIWTAIAVVGRGEARLVVLSGLGLGGALITSYIRAKGEALGSYRDSGVLGRTERVILVGLALVSGWLVAVLSLLVVLIWVTVVQRLTQTWRGLGRG